jgi:hypothetical protein
LPEQLLQGDMQAIHHEGDEDMRLYALLVLMMEEADRYRLSWSAIGIGPRGGGPF